MLSLLPSRSSSPVSRSVWDSKEDALTPAAISLIFMPVCLNVIRFNVTGGSRQVNKSQPVKRDTNPGGKSLPLAREAKLLTVR